LPKCAQHPLSVDIFARHVRMLEFVFCLLVLLPARSRAAQEVRVLLYHVQETLGFTEQGFRQHMDFLVANEYETINIGEFLAWYDHGAALPDRPILITLDDNYIGVYTEVYPMLQARGMCGVNFAHSSYVGVPPGGPPPTSFDHCDWNELQEMEDAGVLITESHTRMHRDLTLLNTDDAWWEIYGSKQDIEGSMTAKTCYAIAYPYGSYNAEVLALVESAGYLLGFSTISGPNTRATPRYELRRIGLTSQESIETFKQAIDYVPPGTIIVDNRDDGFTTGGLWGTSTSVTGYYGPDYFYCAAGAGTTTATWGFTVSRDGTYDLAARWTASTNRTSNAPFTIQTPATLDTVWMDQRTNGGQWNLLGRYYLLQGDHVNITLSNNADGYVIADAIRCMPVAETRVPDWELYE
jgi:peptidoglycan/xylan/chitin deacetylase (PgdA/CDA1 family)